MSKVNASTILNKSPQKVKLMIDPIRNMKLDLALETVSTMNKGKTKKLYDLLKTAANNLQLTPVEYKSFKIDQIWAEKAQILYRSMPRARGSAFRIRKRYSRIKVSLTQI
jgi:large subunit ribosomal protein L22